MNDDFGSNEDCKVTSIVKHQDELDSAGSEDSYSKSRSARSMHRFQSKQVHRMHTDDVLYVSSMDNTSQ